MSLYQTFRDCTEYTYYNWPHRHFYVPYDFGSLATSRYSSFFSLIFHFSLVVNPNGKVHYSEGSFFCLLSLGLVFLTRFEDRLYFKTPNNFVLLIFWDEFWVVHMPFVRMIRFKLLAQFLGDHLPHAVVSSLILSLCYFTAFAFYVIDRFVSFTT